MSESLRSFTKNKQMSESLVFLSESLIRSFSGKKRAICSENWWAIPSPGKERQERFTHDRSFVKSDKSESLTFVFLNEQFWAKELSANERKSKFPTLLVTWCHEWLCVPSKRRWCPGQLVSSQEDPEGGVQLYSTTSIQTAQVALPKHTYSYITDCDQVLGNDTVLDNDTA